MKDALLIRRPKILPMVILLLALVAVALIWSLPPDSLVIGLVYKGF